jgi:hypothetical protein
MAHVNLLEGCSRSHPCERAQQVRWFAGLLGVLLFLDPMGTTRGDTPTAWFPVSGTPVNREAQPTNLALERKTPAEEQPVIWRAVKPTARSQRDGIEEVEQVPIVDDPQQIDGPSGPSDFAHGARSTIPRWGLLENLSLFAGLDGAKGPEDLGINANFGWRTHVNWGYPVLEPFGLGIQLGTALNYERTAVRVLRSVDGTRDRVESFTTAGIFQRTDFGLSWGVVYDFLYDNYYQDFSLSQWRGQIGYAVGPNDEVGIWGALRGRGDHGTVGGQSFRLETIDQGNLFWKHTWEHEIATRMWIGLADQHGRFVLVAPGNTAVHHPFAFGADVFVPLSERLAIYGEAQFITPNDTGTVTATFGLAFFSGAGARTAGRNRFAPLLPVAK